MPSQFSDRVRMMEIRSMSFIAKYGADMSAPTEEMCVNTCGDCVACCVFPFIPRSEVLAVGLPIYRDKACGVMCSECTGNGCSSHNNLPSVCGGYQCLWKFGITDRRPSETGVAYSVEPDYSSPPGRPAIAVVGHCGDVLPILRDPVLLAEAVQLLDFSMITLPVSFVVLRSSVNMARILRKEGEIRCEMVDIITDEGHGKADLSTMRNYELQTFAKP